MNDLTLYALADEYRQLLDLAADPEADAESFAAALADLGGALETKAVAVAQIYRNLSSVADQIDAAVATMERRAERLRARAERVREYLKASMEAGGIGKIESPWFSLAIRNNPPSVVVDDEEAIPSEMRAVVPARWRPDKMKIKQALLDGEAVPGCHLENSTRLEIK